MGEIKSYHIDEPVDTCPYDRTDVIRNLQFIAELLDMSNATEETKRCFQTCASEIESATDYLLARLQHSEVERFNR